MYTPEELKLVKKRNYGRVKELVRVSLALGVNLKRQTRFKDGLRVINVILVLASAVSLYGNWCLTLRFIDNMPKIAESVSTFFQTIISMIKMVNYLFVQRKMHLLLYKVIAHDLIQSIEMFKTDFPINDRLKREIEAVMEKSWRNIRFQLLFYIACVTSIISNYFFGALFTNLYHNIKQTPDYMIVLPFPGLFPFWESKGQSFPYYHLQMFFSGSADYIGGMCAISYDGLFIILTVHAVGLVRVLNVLAANSTSPDVPKHRRVEYLRYCIYFHQRILDYIDEVRQEYKHIALAQFLMSLVIWGIVLFQISFGVASDFVILIRMIMYISAAGYQNVLYCLNGQFLTTESEKTAGAFYDCEWYNESREFKTLTRMMLTRTSKISYMHISWFTVMTFPTLLSMFQTSGSYFLLLRNVTE